MHKIPADRILPEDTIQQIKNRTSVSADAEYPTDRQEKRKYLPHRKACRTKT